MSKTRSKKSGYTKVGDYVELRVPRDAKYEDVARSAATAVGLNDPTDSSSDEDIAHSKGTLVLLRADGTECPILLYQMTCLLHGPSTTICVGSPLTEGLQQL